MPNLIAGYLLEDGNGVRYLVLDETRAKRVKQKMEYDEEKVGVDIVYRALTEPITMIAANSGQDAGWVLKTVEAARGPDYGFDSMKLDFGSMFKKGIVDPVKVVRTALENATSVATMILTTEALVTDIPEEKPVTGGGMPGGMGGMDMGM